VTPTGDTAFRVAPDEESVMASHLLNRGRGIVWRRRIPRRLAVSLGRSHVLVHLSTRDPGEAARLGRRLSVAFDDFIDAMNTITRTPAPEDLEKLLLSFRSLVKERCETAQLLFVRPSEEQKEEIKRLAPTTLQELERRFAVEEVYLEQDPAARAVFDERRRAQARTAGFHDLSRLVTRWHDALDRNDPGVIREILIEVLEINGVDLRPGSLAYAKFGREALKQGIAEVQEFTGLARDAEPLRSSPRMSSLIEPFFKDKKQNHDGHRGYDKHTVKQYALSYELWLQLNEDRPIREYTRQDAWLFYDMMKQMPLHHGKSIHDNMTIREQVDWANAQGPDHPRIVLKTVKRHFTALNQLWKWSRTRGHVDDIISSGFEFGTRSKKDKRHAWPPELLILLFQSDWWGPSSDRNTARYWAALISLHCGLRREEICQLYVSDIKERDSIAYFDLVETDGRRLKTSTSIREVPVHPFLIELGFLDLVERRRKQKAKFLFADIKPSAPIGKRGDRLTKAFGTHIRSIGVDDKKIVLHSFRHNFRTVLESASLEERWIDAVMGHENPRRSEGGKTYAKSITLERAREVVCAFTPTVDLSFLKAK
jgi:integrase